MNVVSGRAAAWRHVRRGWGLAPELRAVLACSLGAYLAALLAFRGSGGATERSERR